LLRNTSSFANSFKHHKYVDDALKEELGTMYIDIPGFYRGILWGSGRSRDASKVVFQEMQRRQ
jgi:hypothetical protein